ncbi:hypothetical protein QTO34_004037 [Cnephaeus nilssonii]|uniref:Transmembrane 4 L6 family member 1 n=1 Tax=Cnephaeus nilssonii TaxID=3371016 RepID=A0AA40HRZ7_CNENI|nr:hypothetical protein QTO34_004037 [Eptesicus nilssonii]
MTCLPGHTTYQRRRWEGGRGTCSWGSAVVHSLQMLERRVPGCFLSLFQGGVTMCSETGSRYTGMLLLPLAIAAIIANLLLYFPNGQVLEPAKITDLVWFFHGFLGAGLLQSLLKRSFNYSRPQCQAPSYGASTNAVERRWRRLLCPQMWDAVPCASGHPGHNGGCVLCGHFFTGFAQWPFCDTGSGNYTYPFRNDSLEGNYLFNQPTWATCQEPEHIVLWNVVLFSILLGIGVVEAVLCLSQVISGLCDVYCGTCIRKGQVNITGL